MRSHLLGIALLFICSQSFAEQIPSIYAGVWELTSSVKDGQTKPPTAKHYLMLTSGGEMTRVKDLDYPTWKDAPKQNIRIDNRGIMSTIAPDGTIVALGKATISEGKLHLEAADGEHHLVYSPVKIEIRK